MSISSSIPNISIPLVVKDTIGNFRMNAQWHRFFTDFFIESAAGVSGTGYVVKTGSTVTTRSITSSNGDINLVNPAGVSGNTDLSLSDTGISATIYGSATQVSQVTFDAKGRATTAVNIPIQITESQVTNLTTDLAAKQPLDSTLTSLAAYNTNGIITQTTSDTFIGRTITGTSNQIDVSNGSGVGGNPTVSISATYIGQTSITTLGTITTGTWSATTIAVNKGGTGVTACPKFAAVLSSNQSISSATLTKIQFNSETFDTNSNYDNATNYRFTPTIAGKYQINAAVTITAGTVTTNFLLMIYKNGSVYRTLNMAVSNIASGSNTQTVADVIDFNGSSDYVEIFINVTSVGGVTAVSNDCWFSGTFVP